MHNSDVLTYWFFGVVLLILIAAVIVKHIRAQKRTDALQTVAQEIGFYFAGNDWSDQSQAPQTGIALFKRGGGGRFKNIMTGTSAGFRTSLFDYSFTVGGAKSRRTFTQTVAAFSQDLLLPRFDMRPEGFLDRIGDAFVHKDIDFASHPEFSRLYLLRGSEQDSIRELFTPALLTFLEGLPSDDKWHIEGVGATLILYRSDVTVGADRIHAFLDETFSIARTFFSSCGLKKRLA
jgi:hypothetical protein